MSQAECVPTTTSLSGRACSHVRKASALQAICSILSLERVCHMLSSSPQRVVHAAVLVSVVRQRGALVAQEHPHLLSAALVGYDRYEGVLQHVIAEADENRLRRALHRRHHVQLRLQSAGQPLQPLGVFAADGGERGVVYAWEQVGAVLLHSEVVVARLGEGSSVVASHLA
eukprot:CAMPEP_0173216004 /NCGR_PEP_ID=MMETSP1141-20130122/26788_1 /TAXON_ID=483371 /ORGANISM="non described non described, Strain CCMP2298" /LENGTH=170 /DNA_ID=CAMNT_0014143433 /DNA_START=98 /DNA_END=610 /DNA_ORIENTATION=-